jgi:heme-degrading monooxygenase HmoA
MQSQFEEAYGYRGAWVSLSRTDPAYIRTELIQDVRDANRYLTLDFWESEAAYEAAEKMNTRMSMPVVSR